MRLSVIVPGYENPSWRWFRCVDDVYAETLAQLIDNFTLFGVKRNAHSGIVQSQVVLDDLFR